jgi:hypothetical protein
MKLQYILTILMVSVVLGGCKDSSRQELERDMFKTCMNSSDAAMPGEITNPTEWVEIIKACRVVSADTFKGYVQEKDDE